MYNLQTDAARRQQAVTGLSQMALAGAQGYKDYLGYDRDAAKYKFAGKRNYDFCQSCC